MAPQLNMSGATAILLGAGRGTRMGGPKVRLITPQGALVAQHVRHLVAAGCEAIVIGTRPEDRSPVERAVSVESGTSVWVTSIDSPEPAATLAHCVRLARARGLLRGVVFVAPIDTPPPTVRTLEALQRAFEADTLVVTPLHEHRGGHPVACVGALLARAYDVDDGIAPPSLREVVRAVDGARIRVAVDDPTVTMPLDTPEEFTAFFGTSPTFF